MVEQAVNLTNCDREPIHIPGSIQPHGALLACDARLQRVERHSENANAVLGIQGELNGQELAALVGAKVAHDLKNAVGSAASSERAALLFGVKLPSSELSFDISIHRHKQTAIIEFEPAAPASEPLSLARELTSRISTITDLDRLVGQSARLLQALLRYDRVMVYRFERDGSGKVVAEVKRPDLERFLGQYFPASDIPQQARVLYLRKTIRIISDARGDRVPIVPILDASGEPLDLSFAHLRSVSPVHLEYLRNMGVAASMSISIIIDGELWGLIACHHYSPKWMTMGERVAAEMFGEFFSLHLNALTQKRRLESASRARHALDRFMQLSSSHASLASPLVETLPDLQKLLPCGGVGLWIDGTFHSIGIAPPPDRIPDLAASLSAVCEGHVWATHALATRLPEAADYAAQAAGVLGVPISSVQGDMLMFFRPELVHTLEWAGNPEKSYDTGPLGDRLTPRKSFEIWKQTVHGQSQPWTDDDREIAEAVRSAVVEIALRHNDLLMEERAKADVRQRMLNEELNHRVKNILALIKSLVGYSVDQGSAIHQYAESLKGRINALANAHDQIARGDGGGRLADLISAELSPYLEVSRIDLAGPPLSLDGRAYSVVALVLHELATNAAKYGALSVPSGTLKVDWTILPGGDCQINWRESGGPVVRPPKRRGLGTALIDRSIPFDLGGRSDVAFNPAGIEASLVIPAKHVAESAPGAPTDFEARPDPGSVTASLRDARILLVEDQMLIAMDVEESLAQGGIVNVVTCNSVASALREVDRSRPDLAVLDVNLGDTTSAPVAHRLVELGVPFLFATGYSDTATIPNELRSRPMLRKPYDAALLIRLMGEVYATANSD